MKSLSNCVIQNSSSTRDQSQMKSLQGKGAGAWLLTVPSSSYGMHYLRAISAWYP